MAKNTFRGPILVPEAAFCRFWGLVCVEKWSCDHHDVKSCCRMLQRENDQILSASARMRLDITPEQWGSFVLLQSGLTSFFFIHLPLTSFILFIHFILNVIYPHNWNFGFPTLFPNYTVWCNYTIQCKIINVLHWLV